MALFKNKKEETKKQTENAGVKSVNNTKDKKTKESVQQVAPASLSDVIIAPRITEKSVRLMDKGVYTFNVRKDVTKNEIVKAIKAIYKVEPLRVRIVNYPAKVKYNHKTGRKGFKSGGKKALVYLKEGDKISII